MKLNKFTFFFLPFFIISSTIGANVLENTDLSDLPLDQKKSIEERLERAQNIQESINEDIEKLSLIRKPELIAKEDLCEDCIVGFELFDLSPTTFAPGDTAPVTGSYIVGSGDQFIIEYFGNVSTKQTVQISREGVINLPEIGPLTVNGLSFDELKNLITNKVQSNLIGTEVSTTLSELRSINVYIVGQSYKPGAYTISAMSSITNALFASGGVNESGSLRNIEIKRNGRTIHEYDFYQLILKGDTSSDIRLMNGDTIFIPFLVNVVRLNGEFRKPGLYEFKDKETVGDLLELAGGIKNNFSAGTQLELSRLNRDIGLRELETISLLNKNDLDKIVANGDVINLAQKSGLEDKVVELKGEFVRPGFYSLSAGETVISVINRAGGYTDYAYDEGAIFTRKQVAEQQKEGFIRNADILEETLANAITNGNIENASEFTLSPITTLIKKLRDFEPIGRQVVDLDLLTLKTDPYKNFELRSGDTITIPKRPISINVVGEVLNSSSHAFESDFSVYDYINLSGGISDQADEDKIVLVLPNGQSSLYKKKLFGNDSSNLIPGTTIVVSKDPRPPFEAIQITSIVTPILADLATAAAALNAISN